VNVVPGDRDAAAGSAAKPASGAQDGAPKAQARAWRRIVLRRLVVVSLIALWVGAVVYPDPRPLVTSLARLKTPPVEAAPVAGVAATLPDDYRAIEKFSLDYVEYQPAWIVYGLPWYFPTVQEVVHDKAGDCQARALLFASILQAKGMPYTLRYSFDHVWVDYPGKAPPAMEDPATSFVADDGKGWLAKLPAKIPLWTIIKVRVGYHWSPMPLLQKIIIVLGSLLIIGWGEKSWLKRLWARAGLWPVRRGAVAED
jgi:hypothetical protein